MRVCNNALISTLTVLCNRDVLRIGTKQVNIILEVVTRGEGNFFVLVLGPSYVCASEAEHLFLFRQNPYSDFAYDGVMINPFEVLFVKVKGYQLESDWIASKMAATYDRWKRSEVCHTVSARHECLSGCGKEEA